MPELAPEAWDAIARQYAAGIPITVIARNFNVSRARIKLKADRFGWVRNRASEGAAAKQLQTQEDDLGSTQEGRAAERASVADQRTLLIERQRAAWDDVYRLREDAYRILKGEKPQILRGVEIADVNERLPLVAKLMTIFQKDASAVAAAQEAERRAFGFDYKQQQKVEAEDEITGRRRHELMTSLLSMIEMLSAKAQSTESCEDGERAP